MEGGGGRGGVGTEEKEGEEEGGGFTRCCEKHKAQSFEKQSGCPLEQKLGWH